LNAGSASPGSKVRRKWGEFSLAAVALVILGVVLTGGFDLLSAGRQEVSGDDALTAEKDKEDAETPALGVEGQRYSEAVLRASSTDRALSLEAVSQAVYEDGLPGEVEIGGRTYGEDPGGGLQVYEEFFFTLVGQHHEPVRIANITARITKEEEPPGGTVLYGSPQGANPNEVIAFDLDSDRLSARTGRDDSSFPVPSDQNYFDVQQVTLQMDESLTFRASAVTDRCRCEFVLDVETPDGDVVTVDNDGTPWKISAYAPTYDRAYAWDLTSNLIVPCAWPQGCLSY
jgi:hypothetical protein